MDSQILKNRKFLWACNIGLLSVGVLLLVVGVVLLLGKTAKSEIVYFNRYSEVRFYAAIFSYLYGLLLLVVRHTFFSRPTSQKGVIVISCLLALFACIHGMYNCKTNERIVDNWTGDAYENHLEYRYMAHWSFYDMDKQELDWHFSLADLTKHFYNPVGSDDAHRPRWIGWIVNSLQAKFNTWVYYYFGFSSGNAFSSVCGIFIAGCIGFFVWKITHDMLLSAFSFVLYFTSFDFMGLLVSLNRIGKPLLSIPFLFLILILNLVRPDSPPKAISNRRASVVFILALALLGLDEYGWFMLAVLLGVYWYQHRDVSGEHSNIFRSNLALLFKISVGNAVLVMLIYFLSKFAFTGARLTLTNGLMIDFFGRSLDMVRNIPHIIGYLTDIFFYNIGFYPSHNVHNRLPFMKILMLTVYVLMGVLGWFCFQCGERKKLILRFFSVHILSSISIILFTLFALGNVTRSGTYVYVASPIAVGCPIYLALVAHVLREHKHKALYGLMLFLLATTMVVNTFGFKQASSPWGNSKFETRLSSELKSIRAAIERGETPVLDDDPEQIGQISWITQFNSVTAIYGTEIRTLPMLYYYLLPYIKQGKVKIREEFLKDIYYSSARTKGGT